MTRYVNGEAIERDLDQAEDRGVYAAIAFDAEALAVSAARVADTLTEPEVAAILNSIDPRIWRAIYDLTRTAQQLAVLASVTAGRLAGWESTIPEDEREFADRVAKEAE